MNNFIFLPDGKLHVIKNEASQGDKSSLTKSIDTIDKYFNYFLSLIPNPDNKIRNEGIKVYDKTLADPVVQGSVDTIIQSVKAMEWEIIPNSGSSKEIDIVKEMIQWLFESNMQDDILLAIMYGNQYLDIIYTQENNYWIPYEFNSLAHEAFFYKRNPDTKKIELRVLTEANSMDGVLVPDYKVLVPTYKRTASNPYGKGLLSNCYKSVYIKDNAWNFWSIFVEDNGTPKVDAKISLELVNHLKSLKQDITESEIVELVQKNLKTLRQNGHITHFDGIDVTSLSTGTSDAGITHKDLMDYCDKQIAILLLGHNGASQSTPGKLGNDNTALNILWDRVEAYSGFVRDNINTLIKWFHELNFGTGKAPSIRFYEKDDIGKYKSQAELVQILVNVGLEFNDDFYSDKFNIEKKYFKSNQQKVPEQKPVNSLLNQSEFLNDDQQKEAEKAVKNLEKFGNYIIESNDYQDANDEVINAISDFIDKSDSYESMLHGLYDLYPDLPIDKMKDILTRMLLVTNVYGEDNQKDK